MPRARHRTPVLRSLITPPGTPGGPCADSAGGQECSHTVCMLDRATARVPCAKCGAPIGYARGFESADAGERLEHEQCDPAAQERPWRHVKRRIRAQHVVEVSVPLRSARRAGM